MIFARRRNIVNLLRMKSFTLRFKLSVCFARKSDEKDVAVQLVRHNGRYKITVGRLQSENSTVWKDIFATVRLRRDYIAKTQHDEAAGRV